MDPQRLDKTQWPQVGLIRSYFTTLNGWYAIGTGTLIHPRAILTAAHVIFDPTRSGLPTKFEMVFGGGASAAALGTNGRILQEWKDENRLNPLSPFDLGVILLDPTNTVNGVTPANFFASMNTDLFNHNTDVVGYPIRSDFYNDLALAGGVSLSIDMGSPWDAHRVAYQTVSLEGMSGGPVYRQDELSTVINVRAVNTSIVNGLGNGLIICSALVAWIAKWLEEVS
jgi:V8-like Glu-specific endopeptidase